MKNVTSKELHEQTARCLNLVRRGQRLRVIRNGRADALLVPVTERVDPSWDEIMAEVRAARAKGAGKIKNPILEQRRREKEKYAARLR